LNPLKKLFKQTAIYGLATVIPRLLNVILFEITIVCCVYNVSKC